MIVPFFFLWSNHSTGWAILGNGQVYLLGGQSNLLGGQIPTQLNVIYVPDWRLKVANQRSGPKGMRKSNSSGVLHYIKTGFSVTSRNRIRPYYYTWFGSCLRDQPL